MCYGMRLEICKLNLQYIGSKQALGSILRNTQMKTESKNTPLTNYEIKKTKTCRLITCSKNKEIRELHAYHDYPHCIGIYSHS